MAHAGKEYGFEAVGFSKADVCFLKFLIGCFELSCTFSNPLLKRFIEFEYLFLGPFALGDVAVDSSIAAQSSACVKDRHSAGFKAPEPKTTSGVTNFLRCRLLSSIMGLSLPVSNAADDEIEIGWLKRSETPDVHFWKVLAFFVPCVLEWLIPDFLDVKKVCGGKIGSVCQWFDQTVKGALNDPFRTSYWRV